jgi:hypothetical protein
MTRSPFGFLELGRFGEGTQRRAEDFRGACGPPARGRFRPRRVRSLFIPVGSSCSHRAETLRRRLWWGVGVNLDGLIRTDLLAWDSRNNYPRES